jgi:hypothetical protein
MQKSWPKIKFMLPLSGSQDLLSDMHDIRYLPWYVHENFYSRLSKYLCNLVIPPTQVKNNLSKYRSKYHENNEKQHCHINSDWIPLKGMEFKVKSVVQVLQNALMELLRVWVEWDMTQW